MLKQKIKTVYSFFVPKKKKLFLAENNTAPGASLASSGNNDKKSTRLLYHRDIKASSQNDKITEAKHDAWLMN